MASTAHQGPRMPRNGWICKSSMKWLLGLTGEPGRWEWLNLYGIVRKWLLGLTGDHDHSEITRSNCGSYSGPYGSLRMQNNQDGFDITLIYSGSKGLMGTYDTFNGSTCAWYSGSYGSIGEKVQNGLTYMSWIYGSYYRISCGSM